MAKRREERELEPMLSLEPILIIILDNLPWKKTSIYCVYIHHIPYLVSSKFKQQLLVVLNLLFALTVIRTKSTSTATLTLITVNWLVKDKQFQDESFDNLLPTNWYCYMHKVEVTNKFILVTKYFTEWLCDLAVIALIANFSYAYFLKS